MSSGEEESDFRKLPTEMFLKVLSLVNLQEKQLARLMCKRWRCILDDSGLLCFKQTNGNMTEDSIQCLLKTELYIDHLVLKGVNVTWPAMTYTENKFPRIRKLTLESGNSDQTLMTILQYGCAQAESLTLDNYCFSHFRLTNLSRILPGLMCYQLTQLSFKAVADASPRIEFPLVYGLKNSQENNVDGIDLILKNARIPNLRVLRLDLISIGENELRAGIRKLMSTFAIFLEHHSNTLKVLRLDLFLVFVRADREGILTFPNISAPLYSAEQQITVARDLKLECLDISSTHVDALVHLVPPCIWESENLTKLTWRPIWANSWLKSNPPSDTATVKPIQALIQHNRNTLTNVTTTFIRGDIDIDPFDMSWLESCHHLRELTITNCSKFWGAELQFPTVRKVEIGLIEDFEYFGSITTWMSRSFQNLDAVQFSVCFTSVLRNRDLNWIQNLLPLPRLREIRFQFSYWFEDLHLGFTGPNLIRQYCSEEARLMFKGKKQRGREDGLHPCGPCFIKMLPIQN